MPQKREATGLIPTDSMNKPSAVRCVSNRSATATAATMYSDTGMPKMKPLPMKKKGS